jgi:hypothetical protein
MPDADVTHRIAAALAEIIMNMAERRMPDGDDGSDSSARNQRLVLSAAVYRLLRGDHVPSAVRTGQRQDEPSAAPGRRIGPARRAVGTKLRHFTAALTAPGEGDPANARQLAERAVKVLRAFAECTVVVAEADRTPATLIVTVPSRALHGPGSGVADDESPGTAAPRWRYPGSWRWLHPDRWNWIVPRARLRIDLLLPSSEADRQVEVRLPEGVALDPSRPRDLRAELEIRTAEPPPARQLRMLVAQLVSAPAAWVTPLYQALADLARAKAAAALESLREHRVAAAPGTHTGTGNYRRRLERPDQALGQILSQGRQPGLVAELARWQADASEPPGPMQRRATVEVASPDVVVARARMIEDASQRAAPTRARICVHIAVTDAEHFSIAQFSGWMSALLMTVVLGFFLVETTLGRSSQPISPEVLAIVLTLFSAIQAGRIEQPDRSTLRGLISQAGSGLIVASVMPAVVLAVALAFSRSTAWVVGWAAAAITGQLLLQFLLHQRVSRRRAGGAPSGRPPRKDVRRPADLVFFTDALDYSHYEVLHSSWWRSTTGGALLVGRQAYGFVTWQHGDPRQSLRSMLQSGRPAGRRGTRRPDMPANVLALQRSGTARQSLTFAVFRDEPRRGWAPAARRDMARVDLDPGRLTPSTEVSGVISVFVGLPCGQGLPTVARHPVTEVLRAASEQRLTVLEVQLPLPPPGLAYADLLWARVQVALTEDYDLDRLTPLLTSIGQLTSALVGVQTAPESMPWMLSPRPPAPGRGQVIRARDLDVIRASGLDQAEDSAARTWRIVALCADWRLGIEARLLDGLDPGLELGALTSATLFGKAVMLLLAHQAEPDSQRPVTTDDLVSVPVDRCQSSAELGEASEDPLLQVHMRTPDRPGATLEVLEALRATVAEMAPGAVAGRDWDVWYARSDVSSGLANIQLTAQLAADPQAPAHGKPVSDWGPAECSAIAQRALALAAARTSPDLGLPENTVISVDLMRIP